MAAPNRLELVEGCRADALGGRVRAAELGMCLLQGLQPAEEGVVLLVGHDRVVEDVVPVVVVLDLLPEPLDLTTGVLRGARRCGA